MDEQPSALPARPRWRTAGKWLAIILLLAVGFAMLGVLWPAVIAACIGLLLLAWRRPAVVERLIAHRWIQSVPASWRASPLRFATAVAAVLIPLTLLSMLVARGDGAEVEIEPTPAAVVAAELTPTPVPTPAPVSTPTPAPTPTPPPPTPAGPTDAERAYAAEAMRVTRDTQRSLERLVPLMEDPRLLDPDWRLAVAVELATWQILRQEFQVLDPPPPMQPAHAKLAEAYDLLVAAGDDLAAGIDNLDASRIEAASEKMTRATRLMHEGAALVPRY